MQFLLDYAEERVRPLAEEAMLSPAVQGIILEPDPVWLYWLALVDYAGRTRARSIGEQLFRRAFYPPFFSEIAFASDARIRRRLSQTFWGPEDLAPLRPITSSDLKDLPDYWKDYSREAGWPENERDPIVVKIRLRPDISPQDRSRLSDLPTADNLGLRVVFETHPLAVLYASPRARTVPLVGGVSIGVGTAHDGTIGGIVRDGSKFFGITCSHVVPNNQDIVDQPAQADSSASAAPIGKRVAGTTLVGSKVSDPCNPYNTATPINTLDVALIEIDDTTAVSTPPEIQNIGVLTGIVPRPLLNRGQQVEFSGKSSGYKVRFLKGVGVPYRLTNRFTGNIHCFLHVLEFETSSGKRRPSKGGDSGAWLCSRYGSGYGWTGMIIGGDGPDGYAIFADGIEQWWKAQGYSMSL
jgi:hypothetical protein